MNMSDFEEIASIDEFVSADRLEVFLEDTPVLLIREKDQFFAIEDVGLSIHDHKHKQC